MDFEPSDDQRALQSATRELLDRRFPNDRLRALEHSGAFDAELWRSLDEIGAFGLATQDAVLVFEELGRALVPGPLVGTHLAYDLHAGAPVACLDRTTPPLLVAHLAVAEALLVIDDDGISLADPGAITATPVARPVDPLTPLHELSALPLREPIGDADAARAWRRTGAVLTGALQVGIATATTERAVAYAKQREQFGRTIGSFQAVKHICADMLVRTEVARAAVHAAAVTLEEPAVGDVPRIVASAKMLADEAANLNGRASIQVQGGMGFTWDVDAHLFLKRAWVHMTEFGTADDHADDLAELL